MSIRIILGEELERRFRELAMRRFGYGKGALSKAAAEAIANWLQQTHASMEIEFVGDPVDAVSGLLSDVDVDAVELQHRAAEMWRLKVLRDASNRHQHIS
ncbi:MAG: hypothetical protein QXI02_04165 [Candidatus Caldarchaeum sp.]